MDSNSDSFIIGEICGDIKSIKETLSRMETSMNRFGERAGQLEEKQNLISIETATLRTCASSLAEHIEDLRASRKYFILAIVGGFLSALWGLLVGGSKH